MKYPLLALAKADPALTEPLLALLQSPRPGKRRDASAVLAAVETLPASAMPALCAASADTDPGVSAFAANALEKHGHACARSAWLRVLDRPEFGEDDDGCNRRGPLEARNSWSQAVDALARGGPAQLLPMLELHASSALKPHRGLIRVINRIGWQHVGPGEAHLAAQLLATFRDAVESFDARERPSQQFRALNAPMILALVEHMTNSPEKQRYFELVERLQSCQWKLLDEVGVTKSGTGCCS